MLERWDAGGDLAAYHLAADDPRAVVLYVHGYAEHAGRHERTIRRLADRGITTYAYDHRGHGRSPGPRAMIPSFEALVDDVQRMRERVAAAEPALPLFFVGASMGGLATIRAVEREPAGLRGVVLIAPALDIGGNTPPLVRALAPLVSRFAPSLPAAKLDVRGLARDPAVAAAFLADPLTYKGDASVRSAHEMVHAGIAALFDASRFSAPVLILHGDHDSICAIAGSQLFVKAVGSNDVTLHTIPGGYHEPLNDAGGDALRDEIADWILERVSR